MIPALLGKPPKPFNQQDEKVSLGKLTIVYAANVARGRSERLVSVRQTFAISRQSTDRRDHLPGMSAGVRATWWSGAASTRAMLARSLLSVVVQDVTRQGLPRPAGFCPGGCRSRWKRLLRRYPGRGAGEVWRAGDLQHRRARSSPRQPSRECLSRPASPQPG